MLGKIYHKMGLLSKGDVTEVDRADLVAEFIGQTAPKVKEAIANAKGGILFIDEAYSLARKSDDAKDFGKEAIEVLLKEMSDGDGDIAIIVAGYPTEMEFFLESNPGLRSRFNITFEFPDYLPEELEQIALFTAEKRGVKFSPEALEYLRKKLMNAYRERSQTFGNARFVNSVIDEAKMNMGLRLMGREHPEELSTEELSVFDKADLELIFKSRERIFADIPVDEDFGMSPVESMACGTPVIGANDGGLKESIIDGKTGILIHPECTPKHITEAIKKLSQYNLKSEDCLARAGDFSLERFTEQLLSFFEEC
jgi:glycosyltransferase involved in cell wall biosynthesis